jgi:hypothetical protein
MGTKTVYVSDLSEQEVDEEELGRLVIKQHPSYADLPITLDVLPDEIEPLTREEAQVVAVAYYPPGARKPHELLVSLAAFDSLAPEGRSLTRILDQALIAEKRRQREAGEAPARRRKTGGDGRGRRGAARRVGIHYGDQDFAGNPHRGRATPGEAEYVRNNLAAVNERLEREGLRQIDPSDPKMQERYGLTGQEARAEEAKA